MGEQLLKFWRWLQNAAQQAAIAEAPAVLTAAGQKINRNTGKVEYDHTNDKGVKQLRSNLAKIGDAGLSAPGAAEAIELGYNIVRHPQQSYRAVKKAGQVVKKKMTNLVKSSHQPAQLQSPLKPRYSDINDTPIESKALQTTPENAASITPEQWTAAQDAAIARGDMEEAQRLRNLHFKVNAPTPYISNGVYLPSGRQSVLSQADYYNGNNDLVTLYHSSVDADNLMREGFDGIEHGLGRTKGEAKGTIFASANQDYAADYSNLYIQDGLSTPDKVGLIELKVPRGSGSYEGNEVRLRPEHIKEIAKSTYEKTPWLKWLKTRKTDNNLFNIKSANAVTFDDTGIRIPLGERDNFNINDIRYALFPFIGGGIGYGLYNTYDR